MSLSEYNVDHSPPATLPEEQRLIRQRNSPQVSLYALCWRYAVLENVNLQKHNLDLPNW